MKRPIEEYMADAASNAPTPGGGSVSALAAALGTTMASMAGNFTVGKKKYAEVEDEVKAVLGQLVETRDKLTAAVQADTEAYAQVSAAYCMPKQTDDEKAARKEAIQAALKAAMQPPLDALRASRVAMVATRRLLDISNKNLITDVGVAAILLEAAARGAYLNVAINLKSLKDEEVVAAARAECDEALAEMAKLAAEVAEGVGKAVTG
jgi:formiminotetrahydrofolate cyclodeaminase